MKKIIAVFVCILVETVMHHTLYAQTLSKAAIIASVEHNLTPDAEYVFADSALLRYNIYDRMAYYHIPSVSIAVINHGQLEWAKGYGLADVEKNKKVNIQTLYQAASISKSLNAMAIMKLVQDGKLSLDRDIRLYLKTWVFPDNDLSRNKIITLRGLLSHSAGIGTGGFTGYSVNDSLPSVNEMLDGKRPANNESIRPVLIPNTKTQYSGGGTLISRKIMDDNISSNYESLLQKLVLKPLSMGRSSFAQPLDSKFKNVAFAYDLNEKQIPGGYHIYPEQAPDGLWTTPSDLSKFIISIQHSLNGDKKTLLNYNDALTMVTPVLQSSGNALGVNIKVKGKEKYFTHSGANTGYRTIYYGGISSGVGVVVFVNSDNDGIINEIVNSVALTYKWPDFYKPEIRKLIKLSTQNLQDIPGDYYTDNKQMKITISNQNGELELLAKKKARMYFLTDSTFFLASSPHQICELSSSNGKHRDILKVKEAGKILLIAKKEK
jgi:CubicO group peptidase (beta-lactamase class C family)